jgi:deoxyadenosine/deoxycytidine kinase
MTRIKNSRDAIMHTHLMGDINQVIITERSILTDKYVFAEMLRDSGDMNQIEWELYDSWFSTFNESNKVSGIIYISTSSATSKERIEIRNRPGEENISMEYLEALDEQHKKWVSSTDLPVLTISTEPGSSVDITIKKIRDFIKMLNKK